MKYKLNFVLFLAIIIFLCSSCTVEHTHKFIEGKCECGEVDPDYEEIKYTITFVDYDNTIIKQITINKGEEVILPDDPVRDGYVFEGWDHDLENIESDLTIKAIYSKIKEKIVVGDLEKYKTLEEALVVANDGDIIYVTEGTYLGAVINKEVEIRGNNYNIDPSSTRNTETIFTSDLIINASNVTINGVTLTEEAKFTFDNLSSDVKNISFLYCKVTNSSVNDDNKRNVAPFNFVSNNGCIISDIVVDYCYINKNNDGRPMAMYIVDVENLSVTNSCFLGGNNKGSYNDAIKIDNKENGNAEFGIRGNVVFKNNTFKDYSQYGLWFRQYSSGNYIIEDNIFVNIGQTEDKHAVVNFISGLEVECLNIEITNNNIIDCYLLFRMDSIEGDLNNTNCIISENALQRSQGTYYIKNEVPDIKIDANYNYYGVDEPNKDKFLGNIDYANYYSNLYEIAGYEKIELKYNTIPYVEVNSSIFIDCELFGFESDEIIWESSNENIANVNEVGEVTGISEGTVIIKAFSEKYDVETSIIVEVYENIEEMDEVIQFVLSIMNSYSNSSTAANSRTNYGVTNPYLYSIVRGATTFLFEDLEIDTDSYVRRGSASLVNNKVEYITIHDTWALPRTAKGLAEFFMTDETSIHYTVGNDGLYQIVRLTDKAAHAGDSPDVAGKFEILQIIKKCF